MDNTKQVNNLIFVVVLQLELVLRVLKEIDMKVYYMLKN